MSGVPGWLTALLAILPVATALGGYWLAGRNEEARDARLAEREELARATAREERLEDERQAFQREVLLELQDRLLDVTRTTMRVILRDRETLRKHGQLYLLPEDLNDRSYTAGVDLIRIRERVLDDELRGQLQALQEFSASIELLATQLRNIPQAPALRRLDDAARELGERHARVNELLGRQLRQILGRS